MGDGRSWPASRRTRGDLFQETGLASPSCLADRSWRALLSNAPSVTTERDEVKYLVAPARARALARTLAARLIPHRLPGQKLPRGGQTTTTVYLDTVDHALYRAALAAGVHVKVRVREYQSSASPVFLELKVRAGQRSTKRRARVPREEVARLLEELSLSPGARSFGQRELEAIAVEIRRLCEGLGKPLVPSCLVRYRRLSWENSAGALRVTLDRGLGAFAPPRRLWELGPLSAVRLHGPLFREAACVLEVKSRGGLPEWLRPLLAQHDATAVEYSKFVCASRAVHGCLS